MPQTRNEMMVQEYLEGRPILEIQREHGLQQRRVFQILREQGVESRKRAVRDPMSPPLSGVHRKVGLKLYDCYFERGWTRRHTANKMGMSIPTVRNIERGTHKIDLFDLQDIAALLKTTIGDLLDES